MINLEIFNFYMFQRLSQWKQNSEDNVIDDSLKSRKNSLASIKVLTTFNRQKSTKSNNSDDSEDDEDNRDNEGRIRIHSGQEVR